MLAQAFLRRFLTVPAILAGLWALPAEASISTIGSLGAFDALGPTTTIDWGIFGANGAIISTPDYRTVGGLTIGIHSSQGLLGRWDEGSGFTGTFLPGAHLLSDGGSKSDSFAISFGTGVSGFATQVDAHYITSGSFSGIVELYDATNALIDTIAFSGIASQAEDGSAPFIGVLSSLPDIFSARFSIDQGSFDPRFAGSLLINSVDVLVASTVPTPATAALLGVGLLGLAFRRRPQPS